MRFRAFWSGRAYLDCCRCPKLPNHRRFGTFSTTCITATVGSSSSGEKGPRGFSLIFRDSGAVTRSCREILTCWFDEYLFFRLGGPQRHYCAVMATAGYLPYPYEAAVSRLMSSNNPFR